MRRRNDSLQASSREEPAVTEDGACDGQRRGSPATEREVCGMTSMRHEDYALADALEELRGAEARMETPPHVEAAMLAAWNQAHAHGMAIRPRNFWRDAAAVAAAVTIA